MSVFIRGKKASSLAIGGKPISEAWYNGKLIFKNGIICYGFLTYEDAQTGVASTVPIIELSDYNKLFNIEFKYSTGSATSHYYNLAFTFGTVNPYNIIGFEFNTNAKTSLVTNTINAGFLQNLFRLNSPISIPNWVTNIGDNFLYHSPNENDALGKPLFNSEVTFGSKVEIVGNNFMYGCNNFNKPVNTKNIKTIGNSFIRAINGHGNTSSFNSEVTLPNVETIGNDFLQGNTIFNNNLTLNDKITSIGSYFLSGCWAFNKSLTLPASLLNIGDYFLYLCTSFNKDLVIPANCTCGSLLFNNKYDNLNDTGISFNSTLTLSAGVSVKGRFLGYCKSTVSPTIVCEADISDITADSYSLLYNNMNQTGPSMKLTGTNAQAMYDAFIGLQTNYGKRLLTVV